MHITSVILSFVSLHLVFTGCTGKTIASDGVAPDRDNGAAMVELLQLLTSDTGEHAQTPDVGIHSDQEAVSMAMSDTVLKEIISAITQDLDLDLQTLLKDCSNGSCQFCTDTQWFLKFCVKASIIEFGFEVIVSVNGITIFSREISIKNPPPFCVNKIPGLRNIADVCLQVYDVDLARESACVKVTFKIKLGPISKKIDLKLGCFQIPSLRDNTGVTSGNKNEGLAFISVH